MKNGLEILADNSVCCRIFFLCYKFLAAKQGNTYWNCYRSRGQLADLDNDISLLQDKPNVITRRPLLRHRYDCEDKTTKLSTESN